MRLSRKRSLPNVPETLKDLADQFDAGLLHRFQACGELIYKGYVVDNSGNHSIIFSSQTLIDRCIAMDATELHVDATFKVIPSTPKCYQLLIINVMIDNYSIPLVYVLIEKKTVEAYDAALHYVKHNLLPEFRPTVILTDFEAALRTELIRHFPTAAAHGCWFHVNQAVWHKMKKLGFLNLINQ
ncbi:unnamed protein product [Macrosiphum euphorbiae]|uniref:MULE transposase domain-containing protein n=1 Tax=Macrosiphum euphorbiae TaxID=13131 RepID=A0AAV0X794_9HEMI|nr:unnamed protein product [Macrosiphum euphorbiae]